MAKGRSQREKRDYVGKIPKQGGGEGGYPNQTPYFSLFYKMAKKCENSQTGKGGGGGPPLGNF